jgi:hypothetical protein
MKPREKQSRNLRSIVDLLCEHQRAAALGSGSERLQEFNQIGFLSPGEIQLELPIVVIDHRQQPNTTTSGVPNRSAANSTLPICEDATMFPATRMTKRSPKPWSKTISAGTRESEHPRMMANGSWPSARLTPAASE